MLLSLRMMPESVRISALKPASLPTQARGPLVREFRTHVDLRHGLGLSLEDSSDPDDGAVTVIGGSEGHELSSILLQTGPVPHGFERLSDAGAVQFSGLVSDLHRLHSQGDLHPTLNSSDRSVFNRDPRVQLLGVIDHPLLGGILVNEKSA